MFEKQESGPLYTMIMWAMVAGSAYVMFLLIRWLVVTREGNIITLSLFGMAVVFYLFSALFGAPGTPRAQATVPSVSNSRMVTQDPNMGWHTVIRNGQICTSYQGQQFPCTPINTNR